MKFVEVLAALESNRHNNRKVKYTHPEWNNQGVYVDIATGTTMCDLDYLPRPLTAEQAMAFNRMTADFDKVDTSTVEQAKAWARAEIFNQREDEKPAKDFTDWGSSFLGNNNHKRAN